MNYVWEFANRIWGFGIYIWVFCCGLSCFGWLDYCVMKVINVNIKIYSCSFKNSLKVKVCNGNNINIEIFWYIYFFILDFYFYID